MIANSAPTVTRALSKAADSGLARLDAQMLLLHALGKPASDRAWLLAHDLDAVPDAAVTAFKALVQRRLHGEPVAYLTGHKEFFGLDLLVDARVLVPRPDTETLVEWALAVLDGFAALAGDGEGLAGCNRGNRGDSPPAGPLLRIRGAIGISALRALRALDLGTGSGAVALAIRHSRPAVHVLATDFSADALAVAEANAKRLRLDVQFRQGSWMAGLQDDVPGRYHLIVSNPPYIATRDPHLAALAHEPLQALASGPDGLDDIRAIIGEAPSCLQRDGWLLLEHGYDQAPQVRALLLEAGFEAVQSRRDLGDIERCSGGRWLGAGMQILTSNAA